jgi:hypothetical protein
VFDRQQERIQNLQVRNNQLLLSLIYIYICIYDFIYQLDLVKPGTKH